jgi:XTP/dITP diphosphohydrolase
MEILIATKNKGKIKELESLLENSLITLRSLTEFPDITEVEETGETFVENAVLKARSYALQTGLWALADDSGLEVEALGGKPGVLSARFAGEGEKSTDEKNTAKLLDELAKSKNTERFARFFCAMAISDKNGDIKFLAEGICNGEIALSPSGTNGFGYDPVFIPEEFKQTFGELPDKIKQKISHRARALEKIIAFLSKNPASELDQTHLHL